MKRKPKFFNSENAKKKKKTSTINRQVSSRKIDPLISVLFHTAYSSIKKIKSRINEITFKS